MRVERVGLGVRVTTSHVMLVLMLAEYVGAGGNARVDEREVCMMTA